VHVKLFESIDLSCSKDHGFEAHNFSGLTCLKPGGSLDAVGGGALLWTLHKLCSIVFGLELFESIGYWLGAADPDDCSLLERRAVK